MVLVVAGPVALGLGVLTAYAQGWLPAELGSLANSSGPWAAVAIAFALLAPSRAVAATTGALVLLALLAGYVIGADIRGFPSSTSLMTFWGLAALTAGPVLGLSAYWLRTRHRTLAPLATGAVAGALIGEGIYGLTFIADTTYPPYWGAEIVAGVALLGTLAVARLRKPGSVGLAVVAAMLVAGTLVAVYSQDLITLL